MIPIDYHDALRSVLARYPAIARPCAEPESLENAGGLSGAQLWRFPSGRGMLVARAWPPEGPPRRALEMIHQWIGRAGRVGFLSLPLASLDGRTIHEEAGRLWEVSPWLSGAPPALGPAERTQVRAAFAGLGAVHQALRVEGVHGTSPGLRDRLLELEWWLSAGFTALEAALGPSEQDAAAALARQWLADARRAAPTWHGLLRDAAGATVWCQPCLRDVRPEHFLFNGERLTGLVDFGAMGVECVSGDLARLLSEWLGTDRSLRAEGLAAYAAIRSLDETETVLIDAFERSAALLGAGRWASWHFLERRPFRDPDAVRLGLRKGVDRLAQRLASDLS
ncbi:MAG: phosphotransferase [Isosphaeraceae bacterium]|nr:phosphotransferase [Isosphaeraceae bacterium]